MDFPIGTSICPDEGCESRLNENLSRLFTNQLQPVPVDEPKKTSICLEQCAVLIKGCGRDSQQQLQFWRKPSHRMFFFLSI